MNSWKKFPESKPLKAGTYLACLHGAMPFMANYVMPTSAFHDGIWRHYYINPAMNQAVSHWMELPAPPK